jgi:cysteine-rich repeat protein
VTVSPDGANLYVAGGYDDALVVFGRNPETGMLTYLQLLEDGAGGVNGLNGADSVAVSPDGTHVLVTGSVDDSLAVFQRDAATGTLTYVERMRDGTAGVDGLHTAQAVAVSPDGTSVYATGSADNGVAVFHVRRCGDGALDPGEQCDDGNVQDGDCCSSTCQFEPATTICRPAAGACDVAEFCTGSSSSCPADQLEPSTFECRGALGSCDEAEFCTGTDTACPADAFKPATVECRPAAGDCDVAETCTGTGPTCPANAKSTAVCRPAAGDCDVAERCDGASDDCPADALEPATVECRPAAGVCDVAETCTGTSATCPTDAFKPATVECRPAAGVCDVAETCTGTGPTCPADAFKPAGTECGPEADACAQASSCNGAAAECQPAEPKVGFEGVLCAFDRHLDQGACSSQTMPPDVGRLFARARTLVAQADGAPAARKRRLLQQAAGLLKKAGKSITRAGRRKHAPLAADCANAAEAMLSDALGRVQAAPR